MPARQIGFIILITFHKYNTKIDWHLVLNSSYFFHEIFIGEIETKIIRA